MIATSGVFVRVFTRDDQLEVATLYRNAMSSYTNENSIPEIPALCRKFLEGKCGPGGDIFDIEKSYFSGDTRSTFLVAVNSSNNQIVGCVGAIPSTQFSPDKYVELVRMCVDNEYRGSGVGILLLEEFERWGYSLSYKHFNLSTLDGMLPAVKFYSKNGFIIHKTYPVNQRGRKKKLACQRVVNSIVFVKHLE
jgi:GNAT superfamily N-acetyltransferase